MVKTVEEIADTTEWSVQWQIFGLSLSVNSGPSMSAKKR